jgi:DNA gyrase subunit A
MGRNTSGVKGIKLGSGDMLVGMVIADPEATLLTICANGYGKRTLFGPNEGKIEEESGDATAEGTVDDTDVADETDSAVEEAIDESEDSSSAQRYRTQRRGGKGLRDIKTSERNGPVVDVVAVTDADEILVMTKGGKLQRLRADGISVIGRNTQGVRIMGMDEGDTVVAVVRVPIDPNPPVAGE